MLRRSPLNRATPAAKAWAEKRAPLARKTPIARTSMKRKPPRVRTAEEGGDPDYLAHLRLQPCVVCGKPASESGTDYGNDAHHPIEGRHALAMKAPDAEAFTLCPFVVGGCHRKFHLGLGFCKGWTKAERRAFEQQEGERQRAIYLDFKATGVMAEPMRRAV